MGTASPVRLPTITLDTTLAELYRKASPKNANKRIAQVLCGTTSGLDLSANFPRNSKYLYQDSPFNDADEKAHNGEPGSKAVLDLQRSLAMKYLSLIPQRDAFVSGNTAVVLFNLDETEEQAAWDRREVERTIAVLPEKQRPRLIFCPGPKHIPVKEEGIDLIACKLNLDGLDDFDLIVPAEIQWFLNSKAALATSGLPTPKCEIIELDGHGGEASICCSTCKEGNDTVATFVIPVSCKGARGQWFVEQSARIRAALEAQPLPFVLKNQQTFGGAGTYLVRTEEDRKKLMDDFFDGGVLRRLLSSVTADNVHLKPATLLLSELVDNPIGDYGVTFFVTEEGGDEGMEPAIFLAASEQMIDDTKAWIGSIIHYDRQDELKAKFGPLVKLAAEWLRKHGYVGPAGCDILETAAPLAGGASAVQPLGANADKAVKDMENSERQGMVSTEGEPDFSRYHIIDLNVRTSGSLSLPLLRTHFTSKGLNSASSFSISARGGRDEFIERFREDFESGRMCILSWYQDPSPDSKGSLADVGVGAEDEAGLKKAIERVREATQEVTF